MQNKLNDYCKSVKVFKFALAVQRKWMRRMRFARIVASGWKSVKRNESIRESIFTNIPDGGEAVFPGDFLSF